MRERCGVWGALRCSRHPSTRSAASRRTRHSASSALAAPRIPTQVPTQKAEEEAGVARSTRPRPSPTRRHASAP